MPKTIQFCKPKTGAVYTYNLQTQGVRGKNIKRITTAEGKIATINDFIEHKSEALLIAKVLGQADLLENIFKVLDWDMTQDQEYTDRLKHYDFILIKPFYQSIFKNINDTSLRDLLRKTRVSILHKKMAWHKKRADYSDARHSLNRYHREVEEAKRLKSNEKFKNKTVK